jgi:hypothetical protein
MQRRKQPVIWQATPAKWGTGVHALFRINDVGTWSELLATKCNTWMYSYGYLVCQALSGIPGFALSGMYIEYQNVVSPSTPVSVPTFQRTDGQAYYEGLAATPDRDFLRVPMMNTPTLSVTPGDEAAFDPGQGNMITCFAQSSGTTGMTGKPFGNTVNSKVCGVALIAMPVPDDRTQDVIFARSYYDVSDQQIPAIGEQFGVSYFLQFRPPA